MNKEFLDLAKKAIDEKWDAFKIMSQMIDLQKQKDAKILENLGYTELANIIKIQ